MTWLEIRPQDVWLFRDGKPFSAGEDHSARSMFPPTPLTVQGALRQKISVAHGVSLWQYKKASQGDSPTQAAGEAVGYIGKHGDLADVGLFSMRGPFLSLRTKSSVIPLLPTPADLLKHKDTHEFHLSTPAQSLLSDLGSTVQFPEVKEGFENLPNYWMSADVFAGYLDGSLPARETFYTAPERQPEEDRKPITALDTYHDGQRIWPASLIYQSEYRFGVSTNAETSFREDGQLYQVQFVRPLDGIGLLVSVSDAIPLHLLDGAISIGGEQRQGHAAVVEGIRIPSRVMSKRFKVIFLTPTYFNNGWQPDNSDWSLVFGYPVTLRSAALYRPLKIGGWNSEKGIARAIHHYVAPGSVYYFEAAEVLPAPNALTQNPEGINAKALGFGQYAIGEW